MFSQFYQKETIEASFKNGFFEKINVSLAISSLGNYILTDFLDLISQL
jgi:hypothetical protein